MIMALDEGKERHEESIIEEEGMQLFSLLCT
jgi:hypothetical protein